MFAYCPSFYFEQVLRLFFHTQVRTCTILSGYISCCEQAGLSFDSSMTVSFRNNEINSALEMLLTQLLLSRTPLIDQEDTSQKYYSVHFDLLTTYIILYVFTFFHEPFRILNEFLKKTLTYLIVSQLSCGNFSPVVMYGMLLTPNTFLLSGSVSYNSIIRTIACVIIKTFLTFEWALKVLCHFFLPSFPRSLSLAGFFLLLQSISQRPFVQLRVYAAK